VLTVVGGVSALLIGRAGGDRAAAAPGVGIGLPVGDAARRPDRR
jgi:hypothetical protein